MRSEQSILLILALTYQACISGSGQLQITRGPLPLADLSSNQPITECLVIPRYTNSSGVATGAGHGPSAMRHSVFLANPFIYRVGETFTPQEGNVRGVLAFGTFIGDGISLDGMTVIAPGYRSRWIWDLWDPLDAAYFELEPLSSNEALAEVARLRRLLSNNELVNEDRMTWSYAGDGPIEIRFTPEERDLVAGYLQDSHSELPVADEGHPE